MEAREGGECSMRHFDGEMVEIELLLPAWQIKALEAEAHSRGLTTGQMVRSLIGTFFDASAMARSDGTDADSSLWT
ncbi:MAG TPA: hypothetical protein VGZ25_05755 [Gemmataceae bacterium]|nr:hypothetical protein [Gemmataceae bacterium]